MQTGIKPGHHRCFLKGREMRAAPIRENQEYLHHGDLSVLVDDEYVEFEDWLEIEIKQAERRALFIGGAWALLMGVLIGLAVGMPLGYYVFYRVVI